MGCLIETAWRLLPCVEFERFVRRVGQNVRAARWASGMTLETLAAEAQLTYRIVGELERGRGNPTLRTLHTLAKHLGVKPSELLSDEPPPKATDKPKRRRPRRR